MTGLTGLTRQSKLLLLSNDGGRFWQTLHAFLSATTALGNVGVHDPVSIESFGRRRREGRQRQGIAHFRPWDIPETDATVFVAVDGREGVRPQLAEFVAAGHARITQMTHVFVVQQVFDRFAHVEAVRFEAFRTSRRSLHHRAPLAPRTPPGRHITSGETLTLFTRSLQFRKASLVFRVLGTAGVDDGRELGGRHASIAVQALRASQQHQRIIAIKPVTL